eukprot:5816899-Amphidinium_carterae.1
MTIPIVTDSAFGLIEVVGGQRPWIRAALLINALSQNYSILVLTRYTECGECDTMCDAMF